MKRRREIMKAHPEVKQLVGPCPYTKYVVAFLVSVHGATAYYIATNDLVWWKWVLITYFIGATCTHALFLAIHEISHDLAATTKANNQFLGMFANLPIVAPYSVAFRDYHLEHHANQGTDGVDTDMPVRAEARLFSGKLGKAIWVMMQIGFYAFRPMMVKQFPPNKFLALNWVIQFTFDYFVYQSFGMAPFYYWGMSAVFAGSIHPVAGHFISEHYVFTPGQETYSYYGPLNWLAFNVGYHNEHHDFLNIPGSRLPQLKEMAPEFYDNLEITKSWPGTVWNYIMMDNMSGFSRMRREKDKYD